MQQKLRMKTMSISLTLFLVVIHISAAAALESGHSKSSHVCNNGCIAANNHYQHWLDAIRNTSFKTLSLTNIQDHAAMKTQQVPGLILSVAKEGLADFRSVQEAVDSIPENSTQRVMIFIHSGIYKEKVSVPSNKPFVTFQGEGKRSTIIRWHDKAYEVQRSGNDNLGTLLSASVAINSDDFAASDISFENRARFPRKAVYRQAVALRISGERAIFLNCGFYGHQDTLYDHQGSHYFLNCTIRGSVDFIFGNGRSLYKNCHLHALGRIGAVTAQGREEANQPTGFAFVRCRVTGKGRPYLGRAWGNFSRVVYVQSQLDSVLDPEAWSDFGHPERRRTVFYGMYHCRGHGAVTAMESGWTKELTYEEARPFLDGSFVDASNWVKPYIGVYLEWTALCASPFV